MPIDLEEIPKHLLEYFGSEKTAAIVADINKKAGLYSTGAIARALYELLVKNLPAHDFISYLEENLNVTPKRAAAIAKEIKERILEREREDLFRWGINISDINVLNAPSLEDLVKEYEEYEEVESETPPEEKRIPLEEIGGLPTKQKEVEIEIKKEEIPPAPKEDAPLILHEEKTLVEEKKPPMKTSKGLPLLGFFKAGREATPPKTLPKATVETPEGKNKILGLIPLPKKEEKKVVHYSEFRTAITPFGASEEFIKIPAEETSPTAPAKPPETPPPPAPPIPPNEPQMPPTGEPKKITPKEEKPTGQTQNSHQHFIMGNVKNNGPKNQAKIEGNVIDLRQ
jgi:hypothetical protein